MRLNRKVLWAGVTLVIMVGMLWYWSDSMWEAERRQVEGEREPEQSMPATLGKAVVMEVSRFAEGGEKPTEQAIAPQETSEGDQREMNMLAERLCGRPSPERDESHLGIQSSEAREAVAAYLSRGDDLLELYYDEMSDEYERVIAKKLERGEYDSPPGKGEDCIAESVRYAEGRPVHVYVVSGEAQRLDYLRGRINEEESLRKGEVLRILKEYGAGD